jgi:hypothetical protein
LFFYFFFSFSFLNPFLSLSLSLPLSRSYLLEPHPVSSHRLAVLVGLARPGLRRLGRPVAQLARDRAQLRVEQLGLLAAAVREDARDGGADEGDGLFVVFEIFFVLSLLG